MSTDHPLGNLFTRPLSALADEAASRVTRANGPRAVCISPEGQVTVEKPDEAVEEDIVGTYRSACRLDLWRQIADDMAAHMAERPLTPRRVRRVYRGRVAKEEAA